MPDEIAETRLDQIRARRAKITPPPWGLSENNFIVTDSMKTPNAGIVAEIDCCNGSPDDADFIVNAPVDIDYLLTQLDARPADEYRRGVEDVMKARIRFWRLLALYFQRKRICDG